ncbi:MAG: ATP-binding cassette domain-containing protein [Sediminibacterium sp.]|nr:ATP-binding cassette domain-containing protein [Sediminibacterium sp.]
MMNNITVTLKQAGKRFNREWIFRKLDYQFKTGGSYAITGSNGTGKSTLLQCIAGSTSLNEGSLEITTTNSSSLISLDEIYKQIAICAPYLELVEEMTAVEMLQFHQQFKPIMPQHSIEEIISIVGLAKASHKQIRQFSSGMKQRIKLAQAIFSNTPILLLDEPCTNLDKEGYALYHQLVQNYCKNKLVIICSNDENEIDFCKERLNIINYK